MMKKLLSILLLTQICLNAQMLSGPSLGMGLNYTAKARGTDALDWNPANLGMLRDYASEVRFLSFSTLTTNNSFSWNDINLYFQKDKFLDEQDKLNFITEIPEDGLRIDSQTKINLVSFVYGRYAFSLTNISSIEGTIPQDFFNLVLFPTEIGKKYDLSSLDVQGFSAIRASFAYSHWITAIKGIPISIGGQFNYHIGLGVIQGIDAGAAIQQDSSGTINGSYYSANARMAGPGGSGISLDIGAATFLMNNKLDLSIAFKNLFGSIKWNSNTKEYIVYGRLDSTDLIDLVDGTYPKEDTSRTIDGFSTPLPVTMNIGAAYHFSDQLTVTADWQQGFDENFGNTYIPQIGAGVEYRPLDYLPLRAGITFGGRVGALYAFGVGLDFESFSFDGAFAMSRGILPSSSTGFIGAFSFQVKM